MQTARCWGGLKLGVGVFECESIHAKIGIHTELKNALKNSPFSALLCVFHSQKQREFRLSLVTSGFDYEANKVTFSSPKRQSFILGHDKTATAQKALSNLIATAQNAKTTANSTATAATNLQKPNLILADLEKAFSQEPVAKEFYQNITACFLEFLQSAKLPENVGENDKRSFLLRLFCRLLFCKFLEKKGLVSSEIFNTKLSQNYYFDILQTLFFATLNTEPSLREKTHLYKLLSPQTKELFSAVPYLNGGLFSPQENDFFKPQEPHAYFRELDLPNSVFDKLFEVLSRYNFTLDEQSSFDTEVALDPELLGTVFESLLSELFTDNNGKDLSLSLRKSTGSYYTPREIVSYMVKESLILYLKFHTQDEEELRRLIFDDETAPFDKAKQQSLLNALKKLKILDPACGSGAFPMGILHEILHLQEKCGDTRSAYERKLEILQECIYGVDIQPMATEIARLRCFLSLIIDQDSNNIQPLPNLEFKFITANSLVNLPVTNSLHYAGYEDDIAKLSKLRSEYFGSHEKAKLQQAYTELRRHIVREDLSIGMSESFENPLLAYDPFDSQSVAGFFDSEYMFGVKSFDIVIGNPPYVLILKEHKDYIKYKQSYKTASGGKINLYNLFFENSLKLIKQNGVLTFITPNTYFSSTDTKNLREILLNETSIYEIIEYTEKQKVFDKARQAVATIVLTNQKLSNHQIKLTTSKQGEQICWQDDLRKRNLLLAISPLILKIEQQKARLKDCFDIFQGEVNLTTKKQFFSLAKGENRLLMWRGDNVGKYYPQSQPKEWCDKTASNLDCKKARIVMQQVSNQSQKFRTKAFISSENFICGNSTNYLISKHNENLLFYLGLINSQVFNFYFNYFSFTNHLTVSELEKVPIPTINSKNQSLVNEIINLVDKILVFKKADKDITELESKIDDLVYQLYNLGDAEISIINI